MNWTNVVTITWLSGAPPGVSGEQAALSRTIGKAIPALALAVILTAYGCSAVDREAAAFPEMPHNPVYYRLDGRQLAADQTMEALQSAASTCRNQGPAGANLGSPAFDACMRAEGYGRRL
jgi:hypothetical protein